MLPGGEREQVFDPRNTTKAPAHLRENQLQCTSEHYKARALADGIPPRAAGLFPPRDAVLHSLALNPRLHAFEKHLPGASSPCELLPKGGWATGDAAAARGLDLRLFYQEPEDGEAYGTICGVVRFGDGACIGDGFHLSVHGGAIETALDEATAELAKLEYAPLVSTREASFSILKPVPPHRSLLVTCRIKEQKGIRCYVEGAIREAPPQLQPAAAAGGGQGQGAAAGGEAGAAGSLGGVGAAVGPPPGEGQVYATCSAMLVNVRMWV